MSFLNPTQNGAKPSSRFSTLKVFKLKPGSSSDTAPPPPPPPKDASHVSSPNPSLNPPSSAFYTKSLFSRSVASLSPSLAPESHWAPATPSTPYPPLASTSEFSKRSDKALANASARVATSSPVPSASGGSLRSLGYGGGDWGGPSTDGGTDSSGSCPNPNSGMYTLNGANSSSYTMGQASINGAKLKKGVLKLASLARRNKSRKDLSDTASASESVSRSVSASEHEDMPGSAEGDEGVSLPWNFQHHIHVDEGYIGLPPSWSAALSQVGFHEDEIAVIHARRRVAATAVIPNTKPAGPSSASSERSPSPHALTATPLTTSTSTSTSTTLLEPIPWASSPSSVSRGTSPAPSFSIKSFVSGIKNSLASDSTSTQGGVNGSRGSDGATGEEPEQYIFVDKNSPEEGGSQGMGETLIEPFLFDTSGVSSHRMDAPGIQQEQQTPRTFAFPHIEVQHAQSDAGYVPFPSSTSRTPSPLFHSASVPIPTPSRSHTYSDDSPSPPHSPAVAGRRPGPVSIPLPTASRRIYQIANASSDSFDGESHSEPPPAYASPKKGEWAPGKEKEELDAVGNLPRPNRLVPPTPAQNILGDPSDVGKHVSREEGQEAAVPETSNNPTDPTNIIPRTADEVMDISLYTNNAIYNEDAEMDPAQQTTPPLVIDKAVSKLAMLPPRISFHQEGSLEDWSQSLFSVIGGKGKRSSVLMGGDAMGMKERTAIRAMSPISAAHESGSTPPTASSSLWSGTVVPSLPDASFANLTLELHTRGTMSAIEEGGEQERAEEEEVKKSPDGDAREQAVDVDMRTTVAEGVQADGSPVVPSAALPSDVLLAPSISSPGKDPDPPASVSSPPARASIDTLPPTPPPKPKPQAQAQPQPQPQPPPQPQFKPTSLAPPTVIAAAPHRTNANVITGISGRSPVNSLFGAKPQPLPIPIPPSQIRAQLRPAPPKPPHPPPTLPLPPIRRTPSQPNLQPPSPRSPVPSPDKATEYGSTALHTSPPDSRPHSSQTLHAVHANPSGRDSDLSTITVTPATIATAKTEVVRTAVASVIYSDTFSVISGQESDVSTADTESQTLSYDTSCTDEESPRTQEHGEVPNDSVVSEASSVSLLRAGSPSKWPAPPPPPVEMELDSTPRRVSRFRTTSLGRVTHLQAMNGTLSSPINSHYSRGSSDTMSSSTGSSESVTTPKGTNGVSPSKMMGGLAIEARLLNSIGDTFGGVDAESEDEGEARPHLSEISPSGSHASTSASTHPLLVQLQPYITPRNPMSCFTDLVEIAEGESGSVFAARVILPSNVQSHEGQQKNAEKPIPPGTSHVAIKRIPLPAAASSASLSDDSPVSNKLVSVLHELALFKNLDHEHLLLFDAVYVCPNSARAEDAAMVDSSLWIRMELMERSLADVIGLVAEGLALQERLVGRFTSDILHGLDYLQKQQTAHRDVRSDNLLVNAAGVVKLADFSNAIRVDRNTPTASDAVGVIYWQAPEMRAGPYNPLKVDVWSLGATVWELAETVPPFSMPASPSAQVSFDIQTARHIGSQWPPLTHPEHYSRAFHEFLRLCGRESATRPGPGELLNTPFVRNACGRTVILQLLAQCHAIEETMAAKETSAGQ